MNEQFTNEDIQQNKVMAVLAYLGILVLVPIFAAPNSKYARFHANQGLVLLIADVCLGVIIGILGAITSALFLSGSWIASVLLAYLFTFVEWVLGIVILVLVIIGIVNAATGKAKKLPIIGKITILK